MTNKTARKPHPVWICRKCSYWVPRLTDEAPECRFCSRPPYGLRKPIFMHEAYRLPPDPKDIQE